jgi:hypothetical protein
MCRKCHKAGNQHGHTLIVRPLTAVPPQLARCLALLSPMHMVPNAAPCWHKCMMEQYVALIGACA